MKSNLQKKTYDEEDDDDIFEPTTEWCIYKVPGDLRRLNHEAYNPQMVSIGPLHYPHYPEMDKTKRIYVKEFLKRTHVNVLKDFEEYIISQRRRINASYAQTFPKLDMVKIISNDVIFIFELFLRNYETNPQPKFDFLLHTPKFKATVKQDLQLLENQIPYFVFQEFFLKLKNSIGPMGGGGYPDPFLILALKFFFDEDSNYDGKIYSNIRHFTDLRRSFMLKNFDPKETPNKHIRGLRSATKLRASGVKFKNPSDKNRSSIEVTCEYRKRPLNSFPFIKLNQLELEIPSIEVDDVMECLVRNVMVFEQLHYPWKTHVCNFILLLDFLIDTEDDVDLLAEKGILVNLIGESGTVANLFNRLGLQGTPGYSCYYNISEKLNAHYEDSWNHAKASLKDVYFNDYWKGLGTIAAVLLLVLTVVQTVCSILQVL